jgi:hypothetical protein
MLQPTITTTVLGILFVTALAAIDWYVWSTAGSASFRRPITARPLTLREFGNKILGRVVAANAGVLPVNVLATNEAKPAQHDDGHGFKKVA